MMYAGIDTRELFENEVLFFIRIKGKDDFFENVYSKPVINQLFPHFTYFNTISEYKNADHYIDLNKFTIKDYSFSDFEIFNEYVKPHLSSIIFRCRGLRSIPFAEAKDLIMRATKFWIDFFQTKPYLKLVVIHIIDNYVLDIMYRIANVYQIKTAVLSEFFIYGYRRHTIYGEYIRSRSIEQAEIDDVLQYFKRNEKSFWLKDISVFRNFKYCLYLFISYYIRVFVRYYIGYKVFGNISYEYRFADQFAKVSIKNFLSDKYFKKIDPILIENDYCGAVYLPLHVYPEANVDYWIVDYNDSDYYITVYEALTYFKERDIKVYVKEHPGFLYQREVGFYKMLSSFSNVTLVHPFDKNVSLVDKIENVIVWHGSAGLEGVMQGKKVVVFDRNYYSHNHLPSLTLFDKRRKFTEEEKRNLIGNILAGIVKFTK